MNLSVSSLGGAQLRHPKAPLPNPNSRTIRLQLERPLIAAAVSLRFDWLRGVDLNHRPLGYESRAVCYFNNLQDAGGYLEKPCKKRLGIVIGQVKDSRVFIGFA